MHFTEHNLLLSQLHNEERMSCTVQYTQAKDECVAMEKDAIWICFSFSNTNMICLGKFDQDSNILLKRTMGTTVKFAVRFQHSAICLQQIMPTYNLITAICCCSCTCYILDVWNIHGSFYFLLLVLTFGLALDFSFKHLKFLFQYWLAKFSSI